MSKVIVVYESLLGNTRSVAEKISEGARQIPGVEVEMTTVKRLLVKDLEKYDKILIGSPTHLGRPTHDTRKLVDRLDSVSLKGKTLAFFNCWSVPTCEGLGVKMLCCCPAILSLLIVQRFCHLLKITCGGPIVSRD